MTKFQFRLETLLKLRRSIRNQRRAELAEAYQADEIAQRHQDQLADEVSQTNEQIRQATQPGSLDVDKLLDAHRYELVIATRQKQLQVQRQQLVQEIERRRQRLVEADRDVRVLEKLRERQSLQHREMEQRTDVKEFDEVAVRLHCKKLRQTVRHGKHDS